MSEKLIKHGKKEVYVFSMRTSESHNFDSHIHQCYEFLYVIEGNFLYTVEGHDYMLSSGDVIFTSPNEMHSYSFPNQGIYKRQFFHVYPPLIKEVSHLIPDINSREPGVGNLIPLAVANKYKIHDIFSGLEEYCENPTTETDTMVLTYAMQMITKISAVLKNENLILGGGLNNKHINTITEYIEKHFTEKIDLDNIASYMYMDKSYLGRMFKKYTGMTLMVYLNMKRIVLAKNLILQGRQATDIYEECGFDNYSTFYRSFKKYVGSSPDNFKKLH